MAILFGMYLVLCLTCNMCVSVCVVFVTCGCAYVWVFQCVG